MFFGHFPELMIVLVLALVVFGPKRLPELGSSLGSGIREFRKATSEASASLTEEQAPALPPARRDAAPSQVVPAAVTAEQAQSAIPDTIVH